MRSGSKHQPCSQATFSLSHDVIFFMVSPLLGRFLVSFNLQSAICGLQSAAGLQSVVCNLRSAVCGLQSVFPRAGKSENGFFLCDTRLQIFQNDSKICEAEVTLTPLINKICKPCKKYRIQTQQLNTAGCRESSYVG